MEYSPIAKKILAHALKIARRERSSHLQSIHLLAAMATLDPQRFASEFKDDAIEIESLVANSRASASFSENLSEVVDDLLCGMKTEDEAWKLAIEIFTSLTTRPPTGGEAQFTMPPDEGELVDTSLNHGVPILDDQILHDIERLTNLTPDTAVDLVSQDAVLLVRGILSLSGDEVGAWNSTIEMLGLKSDYYSDAEELSPLLRSIVSKDDPESHMLAIRVAEAYLDIGNRAAMRDGIVTPDESRKLEEVKLLLRSNLGLAVNSKSPGRIRFESFFSDLIGLESVKAELSKHFELGQLERFREAQNMQFERFTSHLAFLGSPGSGKTEVARRYGLAMKDAGFLSTGKLVEVDRGDLVGSHVGETEKKTMAVLKSAIGGILFIDEAYALVDGYWKSKGYGEEAIDLIVRFMEQNRQNFTLIMAGYRKPMEELLNINEGLRSRIPNSIEFPDYSEEELLEIFRGYVQRNSMSFDIAVERAVLKLINLTREKRDFGGARGVRNIFEATCRNQAVRISHFGSFMTMGDLVTLHESDVPGALEIPDREVDPDVPGYL